MLLLLVFHPSHEKKVQLKPKLYLHDLSHTIPYDFQIYQTVSKNKGNRFIDNSRQTKYVYNKEIIFHLNITAITTLQK